MKSPSGKRNINFDPWTGGESVDIERDLEIQTIQNRLA